MKTELARRDSVLSRRIKRILLCHVCVLALGAAMALAPAAAAKFMHKPLRKQAERASNLPFGDIPNGPLEIFVSIQQQRLHFYSDGVHVADEPVATGVPGHLTPRGIFSVIQRDRYHHSNLYSNAPMPYMERITWSGVALHEGPGVGRQASHGCIRMPGDFAARLWRLRTMGMRVIIAGPELRPQAFADSHLFMHTDAPPNPAVAQAPPVKTAQKSDPALRTDVGDPPVGAADGTPLPAIHKADPANDPADPATHAPAAPGAANAQAPSNATAAASPMPSQPAAPVASDSPASNQVADPPTAKDPTLTEIAKAAAGSGTPPSKLPDPAAATVIATGAAASAAAAQPPAAPTWPQAPTRTADAAATPAADLAAPDSIEQIPIPLSKPARFGSSGPIAIFISRKTSKIYVRQDFTPVFDAPVTIGHPDQPLGTHVYTAMDYLPDHSTFRWTVVSLPGSASRAIERWKYVRTEFGQIRRVRVQERQAVATPPPDTPEDALARIEIPPDIVAQISRLIVPGSSLIISDQGLGPETGAGTDFIVVTR